MPQDLNIPNWYNDDTYIKDKVAECNVIRFGDAEQLPWTAESVRSFLAAANGEEDYQPWMGYDNFVSNGNAENCSPNPLFNVMEYLTAKANQLNGLNEGAGYEGNNAWTAESVLKYFNDHHISAWDHFTTAGQFENVNPSNAMDLSDFLAKKAVQCNSMEFDGKSDWTPESVLAYYQENGINAVQVAVSASDPNVVAVPADEAVTVPAGETPWGLPQLNTVNLEVGKADVVSDDGMPTNFVGTVETSNAKSSFNPDDQITGTTDGDILTVAMNSGFSGMNKGGFVKGVSTVDLTNGSTNDLTFNANGVEGAKTYNIKGNIGLDNLDATGLTVNLANVNTSQGLTIDYAPSVTAGPSDAMTLGLSNVYQPTTNTDQPSKAVDINSTGIEDVTLNSTGPVTNMVNLTGVNYMQSLVVEGDAKLNVTGVDAPLKTIDASKAEANVTIDATGATQITSAALGEGNDTLTVTNILPSATITGGAGSDNLVLMQNRGTFNFDMTDVETVTVAENTGAVTLNGADVEDMTNLNLNGTSNQIIMTDFNTPDLKIQAINANTSDLDIADITNVSIRVGDGDVKTVDSWVDTAQGSRPVNINLGQTSTLTIDATDTINQGARFIAEVDAAKASNLNLNAGTSSVVTILGGSDLNNITQIDATGTGEININRGSVVGVDSKQLIVNTTQMDAGDFTAFFANHSSGAGNLDIQGSGMTDNNITVDGSYSRVNMNTGMGTDTLTLDCGTGKAWTAAQLTGDLGADTADTIIVNGRPFEVINGQTVWSDFSGLKGVDRIVFTDPAAVTDQWNVAVAGTATAGTVILLPAGLTADNVDWDPTYTGQGAGTELGTNVADQFDIAIPHGTRGDGIYGGRGGVDDFQGYVNSVNANVTIQGQQNAAQGTKGAVDVNFGTGSNDLNVMAVDNLTVTGGNLENTVTGTIGSTSNPVVDGNFVMDNSMNNVGGDVVNLDVYAKGSVTMTGASGKNNFFDATVSSGSDVVIDSGAGVNANASNQRAGAFIDILNAGDDVSVSTHGGADVLYLNNLTAGQAGAVGDAVRTLNIDMGAGNDELVVAGNVDLTNWGMPDGVATAIRNVETINIEDGASLNLGGLTATDTPDIIGTGTFTVRAANYGSFDYSDFDDGNVTITGARNNTLNLGDASDTVILGQANDGGNGAFASGTANGVTISNFSAGDDQIDFQGFLSGINGFTGGLDGDDRVTISVVNAAWVVDNSADFVSAVTGTAAAAGQVAVSVTANLDQLADNGIYALNSGFTAAAASDITAMFGNTVTAQLAVTATLANAQDQSGTAVLPGADFYLAKGNDVVLAIDNADHTATNLWYVNNNDGAEGIAAAEVMLIGTLNGVSASDLNANAFA